jgi:hypothetical protein
VTLTPASVSDVSVAWHTVEGTASTADFVAASGTLVIPAGAHGGSIEVKVRADTLKESAEAFTVALTSATGATLGDKSGTVTIRQATAAGLALGDVTLTEPESGSLQIAVPATLRSAAAAAVTFNWMLVAGTAGIGVDAPAASGTSTILKGSLGTLVYVAISGDKVPEATETLTLLVTSVTGAALAGDTGVISIRNNPTDDFGWVPPASVLSGNGNVLYIESPVGDYIGEGQTFAYTPATALLQVTATRTHLRLSANGQTWWYLDIGEPDAARLTPGYYPDAPRYPFSVPGVSFVGDGRGCNTSAGRFIVDSVAYLLGSLSQVTARFEQQCEGGGPALHGYLRWSSLDRSGPPAPKPASDFTWTPPKGAVPATGNYLYVSSPLGDYIGGGQTFLDTDPTYTFTTNNSWTRPIMRVVMPSYAHWWYLTLAAKYNQPQLAIGYYPDVERAPFNNPATGGLDFSGDGRGCNTSVDSFAVDQIRYDAKGLVWIEVRFKQACEGSMTPLYGALRWTRP